MYANNSCYAKQSQVCVIPASPKDVQTNCTALIAPWAEVGRRETFDHGGHISPQFRHIRRHGFWRAQEFVYMTGKLSRNSRKILFVYVKRIQSLHLFYVIKNHSFSTCISHSKLEVTALYFLNYVHDCSLSRYTRKLSCTLWRCSQKRQVLSPFINTCDAIVLNCIICTLPNIRILYGKD